MTNTRENGQWVDVLWIPETGMKKAPNEKEVKLVRGSGCFAGMMEGTPGSRKLLLGATIRQPRLARRKRCVTAFEPIGC